MKLRPLAATLWVSTLLSACGGGGGGSAPAPAPVADTTPPTTSIDSQPAPVTSEVAATITFSASETATFEASLDGAAFVPATSPLSLSALSEGTHTLLVRARDTAGNVDGTPARAQWVITLDAAPTTTIDFQPPIITIESAAVFMFSSNEADATFEASLDGGAYVAANTIPYELTGLAQGLHFLAVRAIDAAGNADPTPATAQWMIVPPPEADTAPPTTTIDLQPPPVSSSDSAVFIFSSSETSTYECSVDSAAFASCPQFFTLTALTDGTHSLSVRATDMAGNTDTSPATAQWIVSVPAPDTSFLSTPAALSRDTSASFSFAPFDPNGTFEGSLDGAAYATVSPGVTFNNLAQGTHTFAVRTRTAAGLVDPTPATHTWVVDRVAPTARISFPTAVGYTSADTLAVRGNANDAHGITDVRVNGIPAHSIDNFQSWRADVALATGTNTITVTVTDAAGNVANGAATAVITNRGEPIYYPRGIDYWATGDRLIVGDRSLNVIYSVTLDEGITRVLSPAPSSPLFRLSDLAVDGVRNRALVVDSQLDALIAVNLTTGVRSEIAPASLADATTRFADGAVIAVDEPNNRAFVTRAGNGSIIGVDLATGVRTVVTSGTIGAGTPLAGATGIALDTVTAPGSPRLLVSEGGTGTGTFDHLIAVDIATGDRTLLSSFGENVGTGPLIHVPGSLRIDAAHHQVMVLDTQGQQIVAVDLSTGNRSVHSAHGLQPGMAATRGMAIEPATSRLLVAKEGGTIVSIDDSVRRSSLVSGSVGSGFAMNYPEGLIIEQATGTPASLLVTDAGTGTLTRVNLATGARTVVSGVSANVGTGPSLAGMVSVVRDTRPQGGGTRVLALVGDPGYSLVSIELATGDRTWVTDLNFASIGVPAVPAVSYPRNLRLDAANNRVYFSDTTGGGNSEALYAIDLTNLTRSTVTSATRGAGPLFDRASAFVLAPSDQPARALVADEGPGGVLAVDLATGDRGVFAAPWAEDPQPGASVASAMFLDSLYSRVIATRVGSTSNLFSMSVTTGAQTILSGQDPVAGTVVGRGPTPFGAMALDVDAADGVAYVGNAWIGALFAIDLVSGDRVMIAR
jgi:hypothetical protein